MDVGATTRWRMAPVQPPADVRALPPTAFPPRPLEAAAPGETAERWGYADGAGEVGFISSVTRAFCGDCNRARLSTEGKLYLCLFASNGYDLRSLVRGGASDEELASAIGHIWQGRSDRYSELRGTLPADTGGDGRRIEMSYIGG
jgi:cyclic pyranopterin phosphate synthase